MPIAIQAISAARSLTIICHQADHAPPSGSKGKSAARHCCSTYLVAMKPVLQSTTKDRRRRARGELFEFLIHLRPVLPDRMLCGKAKARGPARALSHIESA